MARLIRSTAALVFALTAALGSAPDAQSLTTVRILEGLNEPIDLKAPNGDDRLFIAEQFTGQILVYKNGTLLPTPFLDLGAKIYTSENAMGLLGFVFHPDYATNGYFYVTYSALDQTTTISRFQVSAGDPDVADPGSELVMLEQPQPHEVHNGGGMEFSPANGYLYIALGDGGKTNDIDCNAQNLGTWLGKFLRIDVDSGTPYGIPPDNPFVGVPGALPEIWSVGWRQPWRFSFDVNGDLYASDVGQGAREELDFERVDQAGRNYGWPLEEGLICGTGDPANCTPYGGLLCGEPSFVQPIHDYDHFSGCAVIGGRVYRGSAIAGLQGTYFFADHCLAKIWSFELSGGSLVNFQERTSELAPFGSAINVITHVGHDGFGELYFVDRGGEVFKLIQVGDLSVDLPTVSVSAGGTQQLSLQNWEDQIGNVYLILGSVTGTDPGLPLPPFVLPLNFDVYFTITLTPNVVPLVDTFGVVDGTGAATAAFDAPPGLLPASTVGLTLYHAALFHDGVFVTGVTNATTLDLVP